MAWYAELVRKRWYCICGIDMIHEYKKKLYDEFSYGRRKRAPGRN